MVIVGLSLDWLGEHLGELKRPANSTIGIADRNGVTVARFPDHDKFVGKLFPPAVRPYINATARGNAVVAGYDGKDRMIGFVPATEQPVGLFVSIGMYLPDMLADLDRVTLQGTLLMIAGALISLLLALVVGQRFVRRPTEALLAAARHWTSGDLTARAQLTEPPGSEFGNLAAAFNDMAGALGRQQRELQELNATLEARVQSRTQDLTESGNRLQVEMAEREKTEATLRQAQKLQAVGQLAGGIAHDFNNLLTAIVGALELLRARLPAGQEGLVRLLDIALGAAERGGKLTGQLLAFSRRQQLLPAPSDLNMTVIALSNLLGSTLGRSIRIQTDLVQDLWPAMVDPSQIEAAIINLAINARDAMPEGGVLTIATRNVPLERWRQPIAGGLCRGACGGHGHRHDAGADRACVRAVLHHQGARSWLRAWLVTGAWPRRTIRRRCPNREQAGRRHHGDIVVAQSEIATDRGAAGFRFDAPDDPSDGRAFWSSMTIVMYGR